MSDKIRFATITGKPLLPYLSIYEAPNPLLHGHDDSGKQLVNTSSVQNPSSDKTGVAAKSVLEATGSFKHISTSYVEDGEEEKLRGMLKDLADKGTVDLVFTIGCTGFGPTERAPEAVNSLVDRQASGLVHILLTASLQATPFAAVSRPAAGTYKNTLMITLPGGSKAVQENIEALLKADVLQRCVSYMTGVSHVKDVQA